MVAGWWLSPTPLKNDGKSVGMMKFPTQWKKHVPNHQPVVGIMWIFGILSGEVPTDPK
jgi:hypothetical protein